MPPKGKRRGTGRGKAKSEDVSDIEEELPPPPPPRPFKEIEGLPLSIDEPSYSILNNALSLKDSAVLYSSLMRSRKSYTNGNIFDLYWAKGKTKFDNDVNARDRMNKFCDCSVNLGPHSFDVRFFILKDDEIEKKRQDEKEKKKEKRLAAKKMREEKQKLKELKNKAKQEGLDPNSVLRPNQSSTDQPTQESSTPQPIPSGDGADKEGDKSKVEDDHEDEDEEGSDENENESDDNEEQSRETSAQPTSKENTQPPLESQPAPEANLEQPSQQVESIQNEKTIGSQQSTPQAELTPQVEPTSSQSTTQNTPQSRPLPPLQVQNQQPTTTPAPQTSEVPSGQQTQQPPTPKPIPQPVQQQQPPPQNDIMQTPESQMMIANLNLIARAEPALNSLMKIVATGNAKPEQIREFQGYIQRAKAMGPTPYYRQTYGSPAPAVEQTTPPVPKPPKKPKAPKKPKPPKEKQLTTFQEMYVDGADLVFEFSENPNIRYHLPKDSIIEKFDNGDILVSTLVIHNGDQIKKWKARQEAKKAKKEKLEKEENENQGGNEPEEVKEESEEKPNVVKVEKRARRTRNTSEKETEDKEAEVKELAEKEQNEKEKKEKEQKEKEAKEAKEAAEDQEPTPYFSAISFTLTNISKRYLQIFHNSFNKEEEVKSYMEKILKEGIRVPKYYLWYSVDAYEDENLAESLREALYLIENPPKGKNRKRALEENPLIGNVTTKKIKK